MNTRVSVFLCSQRLEVLWLPWGTSDKWKSVCLRTAKRNSYVPGNVHNSSDECCCRMMSIYIHGVLDSIPCFPTVFIHGPKRQRVKLGNYASLCLLAGSLAAEVLLYVGEPLFNGLLQRCTKVRLIVDLGVCIDQQLGNVDVPFPGSVQEVAPCR